MQRQTPEMCFSSKQRYSSRVVKHTLSYSSQRDAVSLAYIIFSCKTSRVSNLQSTRRRSLVFDIFLKVSDIYFSVFSTLPCNYLYCTSKKKALHVALMLDTAQQIQSCCPFVLHLVTELYTWKAGFSKLRNLIGEAKHGG